jgi:hypothetical protein
MTIIKRSAPTHGFIRREFLFENSPSRQFSARDGWLQASLTKTVFSGSAVDVFALREELVSEGIAVLIEPYFKYDVSDDLPQGEFLLISEDVAELRRAVGPSE